MHTIKVSSYPAQSGADHFTNPAAGRGSKSQMMKEEGLLLLETKKSWRKAKISLPIQLRRRIPLAC